MISQTEGWVSMEFLPVLGATIDWLGLEFDWVMQAKRVRFDLSHSGVAVRVVNLHPSLKSSASLDKFYF